jgi:hypothetical protein
MTGEQLGIPPSALDPAELHQAARAYYLLGWSIVPAAAAGKRALIPWRRWQTMAADLEQLERWWRRWPLANVAVITGRLSGVVVIDLDRRHGAERSLAELEGTHGDLPWQAVVETPSGGWHVYLQHPRFPHPELGEQAGRWDRRSRRPRAGAAPTLPPAPGRLPVGRRRPGDGSCHAERVAAPVPASEAPSAAGTAHLE